MLELIKSKYFQKLIFSYLNEQVKLEIIKHNKNIQKLIGLDLINYKVFSGRYIVYESNGITKEFDSYNDRLIYEGTYLKAKRHGKGKEYNKWNGQLIFEGEYKYGKRNGNGSEYDYNFDLTYQGEYLNGKKNGKGKQYFYHKYVTEIEHLNGKIWNINLKDSFTNINNGKGYIKEILKNNNIAFEGYYSNGERNGKGKEYLDNGNLKFEGVYLNGKQWTGKGYNRNNELIYELIKGKGYIKDYGYFGKLIFEGEYMNGVKNGKGIEYLDGEINFEGEYKNGEKNGKGKEYFHNKKLIFEGEYKNGKRNGIGKEYNRLSGEILFEGEFLYGHKIKGKEYDKGKVEYEGEYLYDRKWNGKGYDENGNLLYELKDGTGTVREYNVKLIF